SRTSLMSTVVLLLAIGASKLRNDVGPLPTRFVMPDGQDVVTVTFPVTNLHVDGDRAVIVHAEAVAIQRSVDAARSCRRTDRRHGGFASDTGPFLLVQHPCVRQRLVRRVYRPAGLPHLDLAVVFTDHSGIPPRSPTYRYGSRIRLAPTG